MGVVDDGKEVLSFVDALEPAGNHHGRDAGEGVLNGQPGLFCHRQCDERIGDVETSRHGQSECVVVPTWVGKCAVLRAIVSNCRGSGGIVGGAGGRYCERGTSGLRSDVSHADSPLVVNTDDGSVAACT